MFVDTHCHLTMLDLTPYDGDLDVALQQARAVGGHRFMSISVDLDDHIDHDSDSESRKKVMLIIKNKIRMKKKFLFICSEIAIFVTKSSRFSD